MRPNKTSDIISAVQNLYIRQGNIEQCAQAIINYILIITEAQAVRLNYQRNTSHRQSLTALKNEQNSNLSQNFTQLSFKRNIVSIQLLPEYKNQNTLIIEDFGPELSEVHALINPLISTLNFMLHTEDTVHRLSHKCQMDGLTKTYTKEYFKNTIQKLINHSPQKPFCLLMLDINKFKKINDQYGHWTGDQILIQFCEKLRQSVPDEALIARLGGDEFGILLPSISTSEEAAKIAQVIANTMDLKLNGNNQLISCHTAIGIAFYPDGGLTYQTLYQQSDMALYASKRLNRPYVVASSLQQQHCHEAHELRWPALKIV